MFIWKIRGVLVHLDDALSYTTLCFDSLHMQTNNSTLVRPCSERQQRCIKNAAPSFISMKPLGCIQGSGKESRLIQQTQFFAATPYIVIQQSTALANQVYTNIHSWEIRESSAIVSTEVKNIVTVVSFQELSNPVCVLCRVKAEDTNCSTVFWCLMF